MCGGGRVGVSMNRGVMLGGARRGDIKTAYQVLITRGDQVYELVCSIVCQEKQGKGM